MSEEDEVQSSANWTRDLSRSLTAAEEVQLRLADTMQARLDQVNSASDTLKALHESVVNEWTKHAEPMNRAIRESLSEASRSVLESQRALAQIGVPQWARDAEALRRSIHDGVNEAARFSVESQRALAAVGVPEWARQAEALHKKIQDSVDEAARLVADSQGAIDTLPHWIKQAEDLQRTFLDSQRALAESIPDWSRQAQELQRAFQDSLGEAARLVADSQRAFGQIVVPEWTKGADAIHKAIQDAARYWVEQNHFVTGTADGIWLQVQQNFARSDHVGRLGWTLTMEMDFSDVASLSAMQHPSEADAYMIKWYGTADPELDGLEERLLRVDALEPFRIPLRQSFAAFRRGDFAIVIPFLAALERAMRNLVLPDHFFSTKVKKGVKSLYDKVKADAPRTIEVYFWMSLSSFVQWLYAQYGPAEVGIVRIFRHGIQHGTQAPPNEKSEVLRLFHALDAVSGLYEYGESVQALSDPGKPN
jgi:hypothetical protein